MSTADYIKLEVTIVEDSREMLTTTVEASGTYTDLDSVYESLKGRMREAGALAERDVLARVKIGGSDE